MEIVTHPGSLALGPLPLLSSFQALPWLLAGLCCERSRSQSGSLACWSLVVSRNCQSFQLRLIALPVCITFCKSSDFYAKSERVDDLLWHPGSRINDEEPSENIDLEALNVLSIRALLADPSGTSEIDACSLDNDHFARKFDASFCASPLQVWTLPESSCRFHCDRRGSCSSKAVASPWQKVRAINLPKNAFDTQQMIWGTAFGYCLAESFSAKEKASVQKLTLAEQQSASSSSNRTSMEPSVFLELQTAQSWKSSFMAECRKMISRRLMNFAGVGFLNKLIVRLSSNGISRKMVGCDQTSSL